MDVRPTPADAAGGVPQQTTSAAADDDSCRGAAVCPEPPAEGRGAAVCPEPDPGRELKVAPGPAAPATSAFVAAVAAVGRDGEPSDRRLSASGSVQGPGGRSLGSKASRERMVAGRDAPPSPLARLWVALLVALIPSMQVEPTLRHHYRLWWAHRTLERLSSRAVGRLLPYVVVLPLYVGITATIAPSHPDYVTILSLVAIGVAARVSFTLLVTYRRRDAWTYSGLAWVASAFATVFTAPFFLASLASPSNDFLPAATMAGMYLLTQPGQANGVTSETAALGLIIPATVLLAGRLGGANADLYATALFFSAVLGACAVRRQELQWLGHVRCLLALEEEDRVSGTLLSWLLPSAVLDDLGVRGYRTSNRRLAGVYDEAVLLCVTLDGVDGIAASIGPVAFMQMLNVLTARFDALIAESGAHKTEAHGATFVVAAGAAPHAADADHAPRLARLALALHESLEGSAAAAGAPLRLRCALHAGRVLGGILGHRQPRYRLLGEAMAHASLLLAASRPGQVLMSEQARNLVAAGDPTELEFRTLEVEGDALGALADRSGRVYELQGMGGIVGVSLPPPRQAARGPGVLWSPAAAEIAARDGPGGLTARSRSVAAVFRHEYTHVLSQQPVEAAVAAVGGSGAGSSVSVSPRRPYGSSGSLPARPTPHGNLRLESVNHGAESDADGSADSFPLSSASFDPRGPRTAAGVDRVSSSTGWGGGARALDDTAGTDSATARRLLHREEAITGPAAAAAMLLQASRRSVGHAPAVPFVPRAKGDSNTGVATCGGASGGGARPLTDRRRASLTAEERASRPAVFDPITLQLLSRAQGGGRPLADDGLGGPYGADLDPWSLLFRSPALERGFRSHRLTALLPIAAPAVCFHATVVVTVGAWLHWEYYALAPIDGGVASTAGLALVICCGALAVGGALAVVAAATAPGARHDPNNFGVSLRTLASHRRSGRHSLRDAVASGRRDAFRMRARAALPVVLPAAAVVLGTAFSWWSFTRLVAFTTPALVAVFLSLVIASAVNVTGWRPGLAMMAFLAAQHLALCIGEWRIKSAAGIAPWGTGSSPWIPPVNFRAVVLELVLSFVGFAFHIASPLRSDLMHVEAEDRRDFVSELKAQQRRHLAESVVDAFLPASVASEMRYFLAQGQPPRLGWAFPRAAVMRVEVVGLAKRADRAASDADAASLLAVLDDLYSAFDELLTAHSGADADCGEAAGLHRLGCPLGEGYLVGAGCTASSTNMAEQDAANLAKLAVRFHELAAGYDVSSSAPAGARPLDFPTGRVRLRVALAAGPATAGILGPTTLHYALYGPLMAEVAALGRRAVPGRIRASAAFARQLVGAPPYVSAATLAEASRRLTAAGGGVEAGATSATLSLDRFPTAATPAGAGGDASGGEESGAVTEGSWGGGGDPYADPEYAFELTSEPDWPTEAEAGGAPPPQPPGGLQFGVAAPAGCEPDLWLSPRHRRHNDAAGVAELVAARPYSILEAIF